MDYKIWCIVSNSYCVPMTALSPIGWCFHLVQLYLSWWPTETCLASLMMWTLAMRSSMDADLSFCLQSVELIFVWRKMICIFVFGIPNIPQYLVNACSAVGVKTTGKDLAHLKLHKCSTLHITLAFYIRILLVKTLKIIFLLCLVITFSTFG